MLRKPFFLAASLLGLMLLAPALLLPLPSAAQAPRPSPAPPTQDRNQSECSGSIVASVSSAEVRSCDSISTTVTIEPACPFCMGGLNIVFVQPLEATSEVWMRQVGENMVRELEHYQRDFEKDFNRPFLVQAGVVHYDADRAQRAQDMTTQLTRVRSALGRPRNGVQDAGPYADAAQLAVSMLRAAERSKEAKGFPPCMEVVVFFGSFEGASGEIRELTAQVMRAKAIIEARTRMLFVGCSSEDTLWGCGFFVYMQTNNRYLSTRWESTSKFAGAMMVDFRNVREREEAKEPEVVRDVSLSQVLPPGLEYIEGSGHPAPSAVLRVGGTTTLRWDWHPYRKLEPRTVRYGAQPLELGLWSIEGWFDLEDIHGLDRRVPMASQAISVTGLCITPSPLPSLTPTPTDTPEPTPTAIPSPTRLPSATPSPSPTPTLTATPTPTPAALYLPLALIERCAPERRRMDVILVLDASTSMREPLAGGLTKIAAAQAAAQSFLDAMAFERGDQAALVSFNAEARLLIGLTGDRQALASALAGIELAQQTCLVCAVAAADEELASERHITTNQPVMILLTDGRSNPRPAEEAVDRAGIAQARGVLIFTIGLGAELDVDALRQIASRPDYFFMTPDADELAAIYRAIAVSIPCPPSAYWGGR